MHTRPRRWLSSVGVCLLYLLLCGVPSALGARPHEFKATFGEPCAAEPCEEAQLKEPEGVAVNEATGDVYVVDKGASRLVRFDAAGAFQSELSGPSASGTGTLTEGSSTIESAIATAGAFSVGEELSAPGLSPETKIEAVLGGGVLEISKPAIASELATLSAQQRFERPETIAVDNSCVLRKAKEAELTQGECEAQDPSNGDVYVVDAGHRVVDKFTAAGEYLGQISEQAEGLSVLEVLYGVTVDSTGSVWIFREDRTLTEHSNALVNEFVLQTGEAGTEGFAAPGLAVDAEGQHFYVHHDFEGGRIAKLDPSAKVINQELDNELSTAVSVDGLSDDPAICNTRTVAVFDPEGTLLERLGEEGGAKHLSQCAGIGINATAGSLYVSDAGTDTVALFGPAQPSTPKVESEAAAEVSDQNATLSAQINPRSEVGEAPTEYHFQYGLCESASSCAQSGYEADAPVPDALIQADFEVHGVSVGLEGLKPGATYHFRAIARNSHGEGEPGQEMSFTTQSAGGTLTLADNRGWELVSPPDKHGALIEPIPEIGVVQAAADGQGIAYLADLPVEADPQGYSNLAQVLSRRGADSWSSRDISIPHASTTGFSVGIGPEYRFFDPELTLAAVQPFGEFNPALSEEASESTAYLHELGEGCGSHCFRPLVTGKAGFANVEEGVHFGGEELCKPSVQLAEVACGPEFVGASDDLSHIVLHARSAELKTGAGKESLYEWSAGQLSQVSLLPGAGGPAPRSELGLEDQAARRAISKDGSRIVWESRPNLFLRDMALAQTISLDQAGCVSCESGAGRFQIASADGSRVLFTDSKRLTADSGADPEVSPQKADLYECQITVKVGEPACELSDLTPGHGGEGAAVQGGVLGASEDASYVYYVAEGVQSDAPNAAGQSPVPGQANLYVRHGGSSSFIATLGSGDEHDWRTELAHQPTRVSDNGQWLGLMSEAPLTGYDNRDLSSGKPVAEVYVYDAQTGRLSCASCEPSGARPTGIEYTRLEPGSGGLAGGPHDIWPEHALVAANVPGWTELAVGGRLKSRYQPRYLTDEGRLFFNTAGALVSQDSNATQDVYQYEPPGVGSCSEASETFSARSGGCVSLISSGSSAQESAFLDASESGADVFFLTSARLSPLDTDLARDVYDAHVCTSSLPCISFPDTESPPCTTEASCKAAPSPQPSIFGAPASATFSGPGNLTPTPPKPPVHKVQTRAQKLAKALKACRAKKSKQKRRACEKQARKPYGKAKAKAKKQARKASGK